MRGARLPRHGRAAAPSTPKWFAQAHLLDVVAFVYVKTNARQIHSVTIPTSEDLTVPATLIDHGASATPTKDKPAAAPESTGIASSHAPRPSFQTREVVDIVISADDLEHIISHAGTTTEGQSILVKSLSGLSKKDALLKKNDVIELVDGEPADLSIIREKIAAKLPINLTIRRNSYQDQADDELESSDKRPTIDSGDSRGSTPPASPKKHFTGPPSSPRGIHLAVGRILSTVVDSETSMSEFSAPETLTLDKPGGLLVVIYQIRMLMVPCTQSRDHRDGAV